jgi:hypothetical protein
MNGHSPLHTWCFDSGEEERKQAFTPKLQEHHDVPVRESLDLIEAIHVPPRYASFGRVIAPSAAEATSAAYFAKTPLV